MDQPEIKTIKTILPFCESAGEEKFIAMTLLELAEAIRKNRDKIEKALGEIRPSFNKKQYNLDR